jgi:MFS family permease
MSGHSDRVAPDDLEDLPLLENERFVRFGVAKLLQLLGQNALIYGLFILLVRQQESAVTTSFFVLTATIPSIILSLPGGVVADALPKKLTILMTMCIRIMIAAWFLQYSPGVAAILLLALVTWTVYQFFSPAESAALPAIVSPAKLGAATAWIHGISIAAQIGGAGVVAPIALRVYGSQGLFIIVVFLLLVSTVLFAMIPDLTVPGVKRERMGWMRSLPVGLRTIRSDPVLLRITTLNVLLDSALLVVVVAVPSFVTEVLRTDPSNAVYIFAPGATGMAVGLLTAPVILKVVPPRAVVTFGFALVVTIIIALPFIREIATEFSNRTFVPLQTVEDLLRVRREIGATVLILPFGGLGIMLVRVAARTAVYQHAPQEAIAQVFATQSAIGSVASLLPTLLSGFLLDILEVRIVLVMTGALVAVLAVTALTGPLVALERQDEDAYAGRSPGNS